MLRRHIRSQNVTILTLTLTLITPFRIIMKHYFGWIFFRLLFDMCARLHWNFSRSTILLRLNSKCVMFNVIGTKQKLHKITIMKRRRIEEKKVTRELYSWNENEIIENLKEITVTTHWKKWNFQMKRWKKERKKKS